MGTFLFDSDYANLAAAVTAAAGQTLVISQNHSISSAQTIPADTHLLGNGGSITINVNSQNALVIGGAGVTIEGVELACSASPPSPRTFTVSNGIYADGREDLTVKDCLIHGFYSCGIQLRNCRDAGLHGNRLYDNDGGGSESDICLYSGTGGGRVAIEGNFCLSNNSQGIYVDALGRDADIALTGNVCIATSGGGDEVAANVLARRHGIVVGYNSPDEGNGRIAVTGNVCRNSLWTGIYIATDEGLRRGVVINGNVCSLNGLDEGTALAGGIYVNGGGIGTLIANNAVYDFRGVPANDVGALVVNHTLGGATATLLGNVCDTSSADGIVLKGRANGIHVIANRTFGIARYDLYEAPIASNAAYGGNRIERNAFVRNNADYQSVHIVAADSEQTTYVLDNALIGFDGTNDDDANDGIFVNGGVGTKPVVATGNLIRGFYSGIVNYGYLSGRYDSLLRFDRNQIESCHYGIVLAAYVDSAVMVVEGNRFSGVATPLSGTGGGVAYYSVGYIGRRDNGRLVLLGLNAAPSIGTWAVGDRAEYTGPSAGGNIGAVCTGAGNPGTWKAYGAIAA